MTSVRSRLALALALILVLPSLAAVTAVGLLGPRQVKVSTRGAMVQAADSAARLFTEQCRSLGESARTLALQAGTTNLPALTKDALRYQPDAFVTVVRGGAVRASAGAVPKDLSPAELLEAGCARDQGRATAPEQARGLPVVAQVVEATDASGASLGSVVVGRVVTADLLRRMLPPEVFEGTPTGFAMTCPDGRGVSTAGNDPAVDLVLRRTAAAGGDPVDVGGWQIATATGTAGNCAVAAAVRPPGTAVTTSGVALALLAGLLAALALVLRLAGSLTQPIFALTTAAERVARGDLSTRLPDSGGSELGRLSRAFNHMTGELQTKMGELERSRDQLRENVQRLGDTLQRTHDLDGLLLTVLAAAASSTSSQRATVWLVEGGSVVSRVTWPQNAPRPTTRRMPLRGGLAGEVAADGMPRRVDLGHDAGTVLGGPAMGAPLRRGSSVLGVVVVERGPHEPPFGSEDEATLVSLAGPAGIAVDNVLLHREAQRLSVTDPLTGAGNLRHMTTTLAREVERAIRFGHSLSLLLLDIDHFKAVNDRHGHTVGDAVLREIARRLASCVREVDVVTRYGGEEFVLVTPETDLAGAERLAQRVMSAVSGEPFTIGSDVVAITVSIGIASMPVHASAGGELIRAADQALYAAKRAGRNRCQVASAGHAAPAGEPADR